MLEIEIGAGVNGACWHWEQEAQIAAVEEAEAPTAVVAAEDPIAVVAAGEDPIGSGDYSIADFAEDTAGTAAVVEDIADQNIAGWEDNPVVVDSDSPGPDNPVVDAMKACQ